MQVSRWDGTAPQLQKLGIRGEVAPDGHNMIGLYVPQDQNTPPNRPFGVTDQGKLIFGGRAGPLLGEGVAVTFDPTGIPDNNHPVITIPNASGTMALTSDIAAIASLTLGPGTVDATLPASPGDVVTLGNLSASIGNMSDTLQIQASVQTGGYSEARVYTVSLCYDATGNTWQILAPLSRGATEGQNDFILEIHGSGNVVSLRARKAAGAEAQPLKVWIQHFNPDMAWTTSVSTSTQPAATAFYPGSGSLFYTIHQPLFDGRALTAPRTITIPDASGTMLVSPLTSDIDAGSHTITAGNMVVSHPTNHSNLHIVSPPGYQCDVNYEPGGVAQWLAGAVDGSMYRIWNYQRAMDDFEISSTGVLRLPGYSTSVNNFANDAAAAAGGVPLGGVYHNAGAVRVRIV